MPLGMEEIQRAATLCNLYWTKPLRVLTRDNLLKLANSRILSAALQSALPTG